MRQLFPLALLTTVILAVGCERDSSPDSADSGGRDSPDASIHTGTGELPVTTSAAAREHYDAGLHALDMGRVNDANALFKKSVAIDPGFASGYLMTAVAAASTEEFASNLAMAVKHAAGASAAEKMLIQAWEKGFRNNNEGQVASAIEVTRMHPNSPRAWLTLANFQTGLNQIAEARASLGKAIALAPDMAAAHMQLGNSYLTNEPKDFDLAERHFRTAVNLEPDEATPHDLMGDVHRAQNQLEFAWGDYTRAAALAPESGSPLQQRGHVNSFLGRFEQARADYAKSKELELARGSNNGYFFELWHALVAVHEGKPELAILQYRDIAARAEAADFDGRMDVRIAALDSAAQIATHYGNFEVAESVIGELVTAMREQARKVGMPEFTRAQEATIAYRRGLLAARRGETAAARAKAEQYAQIVAEDANPRKLERMEEILGMTEFQQGNFAAAKGYLTRGDPNDPYTRYHLAVCHAETGDADQADRLFRELAVFNFNGPGYAMVRPDVLRRVSGT